MKRFKAFIKTIFPQVISVANVLIVFASLFFLFELPKQVFFMGLEIVGFLFLTTLGFYYWNFKKKIDLKEENQTLLTENEALKRRILEEKSNIQEYFIMWLHQMKTPITAAKLTTEMNKSSDEMKIIRKNLMYIEDYSNMALSYLKLIDSSTDLDITKVKLDDIIRPLLKRYAALFIDHHIKLNYEKIDDFAISDSKWLGILIEQILSNAIKYTKNGEISIVYHSKEKYLSIEDTGIGIRAEDIPRIFDKGYSGFNGRLNHKSTGLGLFLASRISKKLNHKIELDSELNKGTTFKVYFPEKILSTL